jgi:Na+-driven multidrug efflux pump
VSFVCVLFLIFKNTISTLFTKDEAIVAVIKDTMAVMTIYIWFDSFQGVQIGNIRALGKQGMASIITLGTIYLIGFPLVIIFGFKMNMGIKGFLLGLLIALIVLDLLVAYAVINASWAPVKDQEIQKPEEAKPATKVQLDYSRDSGCS